MRFLGLWCLLFACATQTSSTELRVEEQALLGCWAGQQGEKRVQFRFHADHSVDNRVAGGTWYTGTFAVVGDQLTYNFGEEPPTYTIAVTTTTLSYTDPPFTFTRTACPE